MTKLFTTLSSNGSLSIEQFLSASAGLSKVKVRGYSSTYDLPDFMPLTKKRTIRIEGADVSDRSPRVEVVRLRLTALGREKIASCEVRTLRVEAGGASDQAKLVRDTRQCRPKPVDLGRADR